LKPDGKTRTQPLRSVNVDKGKQLNVATKSKKQSEKEKIKKTALKDATFKECQ
jgi:hypothetical protein